MTTPSMQRINELLAESRQLVATIITYDLTAVEYREVMRQNLERQSAITQEITELSSQVIAEVTLALSGFTDAD